MTYVLTATDRCEACGAEGLVAAEVNGTWLVYCGHHANRYEARLRPQSTQWVDNRDSSNSFILNLTAFEVPIRVET